MDPIVNLTLPRADVTLPDGTVLRRRRLQLVGGVLTVARPGRASETVELAVGMVEQTARATWVMMTDGGQVTVKKSGCNCGGGG